MSHIYPERTVPIPTDVAPAVTCPSISQVFYLFHRYVFVILIVVLYALPSSLILILLFPFYFILFIESEFGVSAQGTSRCHA